VVQFDLRKIISDPNAPYAARVSEKTLLPGNRARLGGIRSRHGSLSPREVPEPRQRKRIRNTEEIKES
jgi:hypothetical protein